MLWIFLSDEKWNDELHLTPHLALYQDLPRYPVSQGTAQLLAEMLLVKEKILAFQFHQCLLVRAEYVC